jgi:hypothetical protein
MKGDNLNRMQHYDAQMRQTRNPAQTTAPKTARTRQWLQVLVQLCQRR